MNGGLRQIVAIAISAVTVIVAAFGLYVEQRRDFHASMATEREARRASDKISDDKIAELRKENVLLLLEVSKDLDLRMNEIKKAQTERDERQDKRQQFLVERVLDNRERILQLENPKQEIGR